MRASGDVNKVFDKFGTKAEFLFIYIREAHPMDGWKMGKDSTINDPKTIAERESAAKKAVSVTKIKFQVLIDGMDDIVAMKYAAWPNRLFVVDKVGKIAYSGKQGPAGFWPTDSHIRPKGAEGKSLFGFLEEWLK